MSVCSRHFDKESLMAFVLRDGFATVSSFWRYHKIIKFTAASIAIHVQSVLQIVVTFKEKEWQRPIAEMQIFTHQMRYLMRSDHFRQDLNLIWLEKIWSDQLDEPALAEVVDQRGVHKLVLKQIKIFKHGKYLWPIIVFESWPILGNLNQSNLSYSLYHQHPLLAQVWKNLGLGESVIPSKHNHNPS